jgi:hypothetical protein
VIQPILSVTPVFPKSAVETAFHRPHTPANWPSRIPTDPAQACIATVILFPVIANYLPLYSSAESLRGDPLPGHLPQCLVNRRNAAQGRQSPQREGRVREGRGLIGSSEPFKPGVTPEAAAEMSKSDP